MLIVTAADFANLSLIESPALARVLKQAQIVPSDRVTPHVVTMYSRLLCVELGTGERRVLRLIYPADKPADEGDVCVLAPAGMALLGARAGKEFEWTLASGTIRRLRIEALLYQPEADLSAHLIIRAGIA